MRRALAAVAALSLVAAACGSIEHEPNLAKAVERTEETGSMRLAMTVDVREPPTDFSWTCDGALDHARKRMSMACDVAPGAIGDEAGAMEWRQVGEWFYFRSAPGQGAKPWTKVGAEGDDEPFDEFSPARILEQLRSASHRTERIGEEVVRGEETVRYALTVDCDTAELADCDGATTTVDIWIADDGVIRRIAFDGTDMSSDLEFFDFGAEVAIEPPPPDEVQDIGALTNSGPCDESAARPIGVQRAIDVLRDHGFRVERDGHGCFGGVARSLTSEGDDDWLTCTVYSTADGGSAFILGGSGSATAKQVERSLENVHCLLLAENGAAVGRLDAALDELRREPGP